MAPSPSSTPELELVRAALAGDAKALENIDAQLRAVADRVQRRFRESGALRDELTQRLRDRLLVAAPGVAPRLSTFTGRGSLEGFLLAVATRLALDLREATPAGGDRGDAAEDPSAGEVETLERQLLRARYGGDARAAFHEALRSLSTRQRSLLKLAFLEGLTLDELAPRYGISRATVGRWLVSARTELREATRRALGDRLALESADAKSLLRSLADDLSLGGGGALSEAGAASSPPRRR